MESRARSWMPRLTGRSSPNRSPSAAGSSSTDAHSLAKQYGVSEPVMENFLTRFAPRRVAEDAYKSSNDIMLFVHIPKTAGISLGKALQQAFDVFYGVRWNDIPKSFRETTRTATYAKSEGGKRQAIMGHFGWPELQVWRNHELPLKCGTIFRNPLARIVSNYNYNCSTAHPDSSNFKSRFPTLQSYAQRVPLDAQLTQAVGFVDSFEGALRKLSSYYTFLGITENLPKSLRHLGYSHGLRNLPEFRENVGNQNAAAEVAPELKEIIDGRSINDAKLHRLMMQIYDAQDSMHS